MIRRPVALAGIMGGAETAVGDDTTRHPARERLLRARRHQRQGPQLRPAYRLLAPLRARRRPERCRLAMERATALLLADRRRPAGAGGRGRERRHLPRRRSSRCAATHPAGARLELTTPPSRTSSAGSACAGVHRRRLDRRHRRQPLRHAAGGGPDRRARPRLRLRPHPGDPRPLRGRHPRAAGDGLRPHARAPSAARSRLVRGRHLQLRQPRAASRHRSRGEPAGAGQSPVRRTVRHAHQPVARPVAGAAAESRPAAAAGAAVRVGSAVSHRPKTACIRSRCWPGGRGARASGAVGRGGRETDFFDLKADVEAVLASVGCADGIT
jgi:hypothetical protein